VTSLIWKLKQNNVEWDRIKTITNSVSINVQQLHEGVPYMPSLLRRCGTSVCSNVGSLIECIFAELLKPEFKLCPSTGRSLIANDDIPDFIEWLHEPLHPDNEWNMRHRMPFNFNQCVIQSSDICDTLIPSLKEAIARMNIADSERSPECGVGNADFLINPHTEPIIFDIKNTRNDYYDDFLQIIYYGVHRNTNFVMIYNPQHGKLSTIDISSIKNELRNAMRREH